MKNSKGFGCILLIGIIVGVFLGSMLIFWLIDLLQQNSLLGGQDWIFFEPAPYAMRILVFTVVILLMEAGMALVNRLTGMKVAESATGFMRFLGKHMAATVAICAVLLFVGFTGFSSVHEETVTAWSALHPAGRTYDFELISSVDTGFSRNGDFYYYINVDGRTLKFSTPSVNYYLYPEYKTETYKEFSDLTARLRALGIPIHADTDSLQYAHYDESCMKYLREVVEG